MSWNDKSPEIKKFIEALFPGTTSKIENKICPMCNLKVNEEDFKEEINKREFTISGLCQDCQNQIFGRIPD